MKECSYFSCPGDSAVSTINVMGKRKKTEPAEPDSPGKKPGTDVIRVEADLAYKLGIIVSIMGGNVSEIVSPHLRPLIERLYAEAIRKAPPPSH